MDLLVFPNQLYRKHPGLKRKPDRVVLIEDSLFFGDWYYPMQFHKQKLWLHRASMRRYESELQAKGFTTEYVEYSSKKHSLDHHLKRLLKTSSSNQVIAADPTDFILQRRLVRICRQQGIDLSLERNPGFMSSPRENSDYRAGKKRWFMADYYKWQRSRLGILVENGEPSGGRWSFDEDNRKKVPKKLLAHIPPMPTSRQDEFGTEAIKYVREKFSSNPGELEQTIYPTSASKAKKWLKDFLAIRFENFGDYEDAIVEGESWLWHSVLTPSLNIGLITPDEVIKEALSFARKNGTPLNSLEGFIRQVIGWREFMRATYEDLGVQMRTTNHWNHQRKIPPSFYNASTGILPIDDTIRRILETGYCHHIERLMVLGGFMFLCEFDPDEIYRWFMEMFVDSYDWVMVPNAYAMSQNADGGLITTKPYFSGSSYIRKMSHHKKARWCEIWDGLYWRWIIRQSDELAKNPRWAMMCSMAKKMDPSKREAHLAIADEYLAVL